MARVRKIKDAKEKLLSLPSLVKNPEDYQGLWKEDFFKNQKDLHLEIGTGKGTFINSLAEKNPDINYLALEKTEDIFLKAIEKNMANPKENIAFLWLDVRDLLTYFGPAELDRLYINFCDPWPKKRHARRRLTHKDFLKTYRKLLAEDGEIHFKTDNEALFEFSLNEFLDEGWQLKNVSLNLYRNLPEDNVATEYEEKFKNLGNPIFRLEAFWPKNN